ncbi:uncharacterized protein BDV17DRAFT_256215 [Aspergillus undulatus]|uniref:uncharacterized protein n=1 Tax=Aspergillus undulatus TaxID=1810928 RepID=UPI003CCD6FF7
MTKNTQQPGAAGPQPSKPLHQRSPTKLALTTITILLLAFFSYISWHYQSPDLSFSASIREPDLSGGSANSVIETEGHPCPLPSTRYSIRTRQATCYPSSGGVWLSELGPLELQHLGINRFASTDRPDLSKEDEDAFCHKLRIFGGSWYDPDPEGQDLYVGGECHELDVFEPVFSTVREVGFPEDGEGGVWILNVDEETGLFPEGMVTVRNALTMDERWEALKKLGAVYCESVEECSLLEDLRKEPWELAGNWDSGANDAL